MDEELIKRKVDRRRLLGRAGAVAATVAGAGAVSAAIASPAQASPGDPLVVGNTTNNANTNETKLTTNSSANPTLTLANSALASGWAGPALRLQPSGTFVAGPTGSLGVNLDGTAFVVIATDYPDFLRTGLNSTITKSFNPVRMVDTRDPARRGNILNPSVLTSTGFVPGGQTLNLNLDPLFVFADTIFANIAVVAGPAAGFLTAYPGGKPRPTVGSNVNWTAGAVVSNFAVVSVGAIGEANNVISLYCAATTHVIVDISGGVVNYHDDIIWSSVPGGDPGLRAADSQRTRPRPDTPRLP
jgi:hypothetical protein